MLLLGANGHAKEVQEIFKTKDLNHELFFFDNVSTIDKGALFYGRPILTNFIEVSELFKNYSNNFGLALGGTINRYELSNRIKDLGGVLRSVISEDSLISSRAVIGEGVNIMPYSGVYGDCKIEEGVLINSFASVHHDSFIGKYSELSPGCRILGGAHIGSFCAVGANAVILPKLKICNNVVIGAGAVVTKNIEIPGIYLGIPAILKK